MADDAPRLDDLIALARDNAESDDPIDELAAAAALKSDLDELTDALLGHFVDQARRAGCSWTQIGTALGVTKQAAQQKHSPTESAFRSLIQRLTAKANLGARFTPRAKAVVVAAQEAAHRLGHDSVAADHLLLAQFSQPEAMAAKVLAGAGVTPEAVEAGVVARLGQRPGPSTGHLKFDASAKHLLEQSLAEALALGHNYIGTEHMLLAALHPDAGEDALRPDGLTYDQARAEVVRLLATL